MQIDPDDFSGELPAPVTVTSAFVARIVAA
jgi:hypothetical protein